MPVRVSDTPVPAAIDAAILDIRKRGISASARSVALRRELAVHNDGEHHVSIPLPIKLRSAGQRRLATFAAGRYCASLAAEYITGASSFDLPVAESGAPIWPRGITGSICHTDSVAIAAVASSGGVSGIGIDYESVVTSEVAEEIEKLVFCDRAEVQVGRGLESGLPWPQLATVTFSAKESLYKALRPLVGRFFEFHDARLVKLSPEHATLRLEVSLGGAFRAGSSFAVRYSLAAGCVATAAVIFPFHDTFTRASLTMPSSFK